MTEKTLPIFSKLAIPFSTILEEYETCCKSKNAEPSKLEAVRDRVLKSAKKCVQDSTDMYAHEWYGNALLFGTDGAPIDIEKATTILEGAVTMGSMQAIRGLAYAYSQGSTSPAKKLPSYIKAVEIHADHFKRMKNDPSYNGFSAYCLFRQYWQGRGVEADHKIAKEYLKKSSVYENAYIVSYMGLLYRDGIVFRKDLKKAYEHYSRAVLISEKNDPHNWKGKPGSPKFGKGHLLYEGLGVEKNERAGLILLKDAAKNGDRYAQDFLDQLS